MFTLSFTLMFFEYGIACRFVDVLKGYQVFQSLMKLSRKSPALPLANENMDMAVTGTKTEEQTFFGTAGGMIRRPTRGRKRLTLRAPDYVIVPMSQPSSVSFFLSLRTAFRKRRYLFPASKIRRAPRTIKNRPAQK